MHQRNRVCAFAVVPFLALGLLAQTTDQPAPPAASSPAAPAAAQTVKIAEHSSRWDYPREATPGPGQEVHLVVKGDTLWDLGAKYLGNPYAWPQIWELNKWVKDPHWIYPGDPILVEASRSTVPQSADQNLANAEVADLQPDFKLVPKPVVGELAFSFQDFIRMPYLVPSTAEAYFKKAGALRIVGHQDDTRDMLGSGDFIFLGGGTDQGVKVGDRLVITTVVARKFRHPDPKRQRAVMGDILQQQGVVRVTTVYAAQSVAVIEHCLDGITQEGYAVPFNEPPTIPNQLRTDIASPVPMKDPISRLIYIPDSKVAAAAGDMVIMDRGASDGFKVGDILLSARSMVMDDTDAKAKDTTNFYLGQMMVVHLEDHTATCRVLRSNREILVDDAVTR